MARKPKRDVAQEITDLMISMLERGTLPWKRPWKSNGGYGRPLRANGVPYSGINALFLGLVGDMKGFGSSYWMTYRQAQELGGQVRKGESASPSIYFNTFEKKETNEHTGEEATRHIRFMRSYSVFNAAQIDGLPDLFYPKPVVGPPPAPSARRAQIDAFFEPIPVDVRHGGNRAFYSLGGDYVQMPPRRSFISEDHYASTLGHELTHSTGAAHRLGREFGKRFGDKAYAFEELVAEIGASRICYELELPHELHESHASYLDGWLSILKADKGAIITAAAKADQAYEWLAAFSKIETDEQEQNDAETCIHAHA
jgi:antirestriction protein ArdC